VFDTNVDRSRNLLGLAFPVATLHHLAKAVLPVGVSRSLFTKGEATFAAEYADSLLLLVRVRDDSDVLSGLEQSLSEDSAQSFLPTRQLEYHTQTADSLTVRAMMQSGLRSAAEHGEGIASALALDRHFVVPLRKRAAAAQISLERISVGRATNKDIVLRDSTVSKFHAWFELHEERDFSLTDAGSTNKTTVNGEELVPRRPHHLTQGDCIKFGSVVALVVSAEALWSAVHVSGP